MPQWGVNRPNQMLLWLKTIWGGQVNEAWWRDNRGFSPFTLGATSCRTSVSMISFMHPRLSVGRLSDTWGDRYFYPFGSNENLITLRRKRKKSSSSSQRNKKYIELKLNYFKPIKPTNDLEMFSNIKRKIWDKNRPALTALLLVS